jgi:ATP-dependent DNA ligase
MSERKNIQLCYPFETKRLESWGYPVLVQPKLDGERCRALFNNVYPGVGGWKLLSSTEEIIISMQHISTELYKSNISPHLELDGELYLHGQPFEEIHSRVSRRVNPHPEADKIEYHIFDLCSNESDSQYERLYTLNKLKTQLKDDKVKIVKTILVHNFDHLWEIYNQFLSEGYEGMIVRHPGANYLRRRSIYVMKFKPKKDDYYTVVGVKEEVDKFGNPKGRLGALLCQDEGQEVTFSVGSGLTDEDRRKYWGVDLTGWLCHIQYQHITPGKGVPRFPVFVKLIEPLHLKEKNNE